MTWASSLAIATDGDVIAVVVVFTVATLSLCFYGWWNGMKMYSIGRQHQRQLDALDSVKKPSTARELMAVYNGLPYEERVLATQVLSEFGERSP